jgi:hypothetical protein
MYCIQNVGSFHLIVPNSNRQNSKKAELTKQNQRPQRPNML